MEGLRLVAPVLCIRDRVLQVCLKVVDHRAQAWGCALRGGERWWAVVHACSTTLLHARQETWHLARTHRRCAAAEPVFTLYSLAVALLHPWGVCPLHPRGGGAATPAAAVRARGGVLAARRCCGCCSGVSRGAAPRLFPVAAANLQRCMACPCLDDRYKYHRNASSQPPGVLAIAWVRYQKARQQGLRLFFCVAYVHGICSSRISDCSIARNIHHKVPTASQHQVPQVTSLDLKSGWPPHHSSSPAC